MAEQIEVCIGQKPLKWSDFIGAIALHCEDLDSGPFRLDQQRRDKYSGGHAFRRLLETHKHALCQDPRDKIYGLVGLAEDIDLDSFPMDYRKSHLEVWVDTMEYMNQNGMLEEVNMVQFGTLLRFLLGGDAVGSVVDIRRLCDPQKPDWLASRRSLPPFLVTVSQHAVVGYVGPSTHELVSEIAKSNRWRTALRNHLREEQGDIQRESDMLMRAILGSDEDTLASEASAHSSDILWNTDQFLSALKAYGSEETGRHREKLESTSEPWHARVYHLEPATIPRVKVLLAKKKKGLLAKKDKKSAQRRRLVPMTGVVPSKTDAGDLICWVEGARRAAVIRPDPDGSKSKGFRVIGMATDTDRLAETKKPSDLERLVELEQLSERPTPTVEETGVELGDDDLWTTSTKEITKPALEVDAITLYLLII
jgi:hypothetical protein